MLRSLCPIAPPLPFAV